MSFEAHVSSGGTKSRTPAPRLPHLDGLRGLAALYVVLHHAAGMYQLEKMIPDAPIESRWLNLFDYGHFTVDLFIVLSGFCLMMPVARSNSASLGNVPRYFIRRAKRILPPYFAALVLCMALIQLPLLRLPDGGGWNMALPPWSPGAILSHIFLVHNFRPDWIFKIDSSMWSVATEWQIYFFFPALLLPVWRFWGAASAIAVGIVVGLLPHLLPSSLPLNLTPGCPWFLGLFAMGMAAAVASLVHDCSRPERLMRRWGLPAAILIATICPVVFAQLGWQSKVVPYDLEFGAASMCLLAYLGYAGNDSSIARALRSLFSSKIPVALGAFSYSLYLIHAPMLVLTYRIGFRVLHFSQNAALPFVFFVSVPAALLASLALYYLVERPFLRARDNPRPQVYAPLPVAIEV